MKNVILISEYRDILRCGIHQFIEEMYPHAEIFESRDHASTLEKLCAYPGIDLLLYGLDIQTSWDLDNFKKLRLVFIVRPC